DRMGALAQPVRNRDVRLRAASQHVRPVGDEFRRRRNGVDDDLVRERELPPGVERHARRVHTVRRGRVPVELHRPRLDPLLADERRDRAIASAEDLDCDEMRMEQAQADRRRRSLGRERARHLPHGERRLLELLPLRRRERDRGRGQQNDDDDDRPPASHRRRGKYFLTYARYFEAGTKPYTCVRPTRYIRSESATTGEY